MSSFFSAINMGTNTSKKVTAALTANATDSLICKGMYYRKKKHMAYTPSMGTLTATSSEKSG